MKIIDKIACQYKSLSDRYPNTPRLVLPIQALMLFFRKTIRHIVAEVSERRYDKAWGINTRGEILGDRLMLASEIQGQANGYAGTPPAIAEHLIRLVADRARGFSFVDYGAGKGRVLLIAVRFPFDRVIGVEASEPLVGVATTNAALFARKHPDLCPIQVLHIDAKNFEIPQNSCVFFFYDPFKSDLMEIIGEKILSSFLSNPRKIFIIYYHPSFAYVFKAPFMLQQDVTDLPEGAMNRYGTPTAAVFETVF